MSATKVKRDPEHVGMAGNVLLCDHCGARQELTVPQPVDSVVALMRAWSKAHAKCRQTPGVSAFRHAASLEQWPMSDDTGISSKAIYQHMRTGYAAPDRWGGTYPRDPADFGRCYRLLLLAPSWRSRITEMSQYGGEWAALAGAWDELTALYEEEVGSSHRGSAPRLYERMKALQDSAALSGSSSRGG
jgi:hypothetical protein